MKDEDRERENENRNENMATEGVRKRGEWKSGEGKERRGGREGSG